MHALLWPLRSDSSSRDSPGLLSSWAGFRLWLLSILDAGALLAWRPTGQRCPTLYWESCSFQLAGSCMQGALKPLGVPVNHLVPSIPLILLPVCFAEEDVENFDVTNLSQDVLRSIEADSFWCMSKLLDGIQVSNWSRRDVSPCLMQQHHCLLAVSPGTSV